MHGNDPLISVLIPAYNHEKYVQETIQSVINQTYKNIELIIIDDGSKDTTFQKIKEMETKCKKRFVRFFYKTQQNKGTCITQNNLIQLSKGDYVAFIASDDKYTSNALADMAIEMNKNLNLALVVGKNYIMDDNSKICYWNKHRKNVYNTTQAKWLTFSDFLMQKTKINFFSSEYGTYEKLIKANHIPNGYLIRKSIFEKTGGYRKEAPLEDHWLMLQLSKYGKMKYIDTPTFYYRWHPNNNIKKRTQIKEFAKKTFKFEYEQLIKNNQEKFLNCFLSPKVKIIITISPFFTLEKEKDFFSKRILLKIYGKSFTLLKKSIK